MVCIVASECIPTEQSEFTMCNFEWILKGLKNWLQEIFHYKAEMLGMISLKFAKIFPTLHLFFFFSGLIMENWVFMSKDFTPLDCMKLRRSLKEHVHLGSVVTFLPTTDLLVSSDRDISIKIWKAATRSIFLFYFFNYRIIFLTDSFYFKDVQSRQHQVPESGLTKSCSVQKVSCRPAVTMKPATQT